MREDIKERIGLIRRGKVPEGYMKTKVGIIPKEWTICKLGEHSIKIGSGKTPRGGDKCYLDRGVAFIRSQNVLCEWLSLNDVVYISELEDKNMKSTRIQPRDVLLNITGASIGRCCVVPDNFKQGNLNQHVCIIRLQKNVDCNYLLSYISCDELGQKQIQSFQAGGNREGLNFQQIAAMLIILPNTDEQQMISNKLSYYGKKIRLMEELIEKKQKQRKWLMYKLLSGEKRLKVFDKEWKMSRFSSLFDERVETNNAYEELLSITGAGIVPRSTLEGKDNSSEDKSKYKKIYVGDIGYNTMRMWQGVSAYSNYEGIVSPAYTILKPKDNADAKFFSYLFKIPSIVFLFYRYSQGLVDDTRNLKYENFKKIEVNIPTDIEEQKAIAKILSQSDKEIELLQQQLEQIKIEKKVMMQLLLTGIVRVNQKGGE